YLAHDRGGRISRRRDDGIFSWNGAEDAFLKRGVEGRQRLRYARVEFENRQQARACCGSAIFRLTDFETRVFGGAIVQQGLVDGLIETDDLDSRRNEHRLLGQRG